MIATDVGRTITPVGGLHLDRGDLLGALRAQAALLTYQVRFTTVPSSALAEALVANLELALGELHQIDLALRTATEEFSGLIESVSEGVCQVAPTGGVTRINAAFATLLGYRSPAHLVSEASALDRVLIRPEIRALIARLESEGAVRQVRMSLQRRDGSVLAALADAHPRRSPFGVFLGVNIFVGLGDDRADGSSLRSRKIRPGQVAG